MSFSVEHAMMCNLGGFPTIRHNEIRDLTASLLSEVCHNVVIEPHLQPLNGEGFHTNLPTLMRIHVSIYMYVPGVFRIMGRMLILM